MKVKGTLPRMYAVYGNAYSELEEVLYQYEQLVEYPMRDQKLITIATMRLRNMRKVESVLSRMYATAMSEPANEPLMVELEDSELYDIRAADSYIKRVNKAIEEATE